MTAEQTELAQRTADAGFLTVTLLVNDSRTLTVDVDDRRVGNHFTVPVREGERALDVYNHPFAYVRDEDLIGA
jgi:hypothetical protein